MYISEMIRNEDWNGGHWIETTCEYGSYSISINPNDKYEEYPRLIIVLDDPKWCGCGESWVRMIPDHEEKDLSTIDRFVENLWEECGLESGDTVAEYRSGCKVMKNNNSSWLVYFRRNDNEEWNLVGDWSTCKKAMSFAANYYVI